MPEAKQNLPYEVLKAAARLLVEARHSFPAADLAKPAHPEAGACDVVRGKARSGLRGAAACR